MSRYLYLAFLSLLFSFEVEGSASWRQVPNESVKPSTPTVEAGPLRISQDAWDLIVYYEAGGRSYYNTRLTRPTWPGGASGVTVGIGSDLRFLTRAGVAREWGHLGTSRVASLQTVVGLGNTTARNALGRVRHVTISWEEAMYQFETFTLPKYGAMAGRAFPKVTELHPHCQGVVLSLVFNRGASMNGPTRLEMRQSRDAIAGGRPQPVPGYIINMCRLWVGRGLDGLLKRRRAEAPLFQRGLDEGS